jgi:penicillin-binding protein 1A
MASHGEITRAQAAAAKAHPLGVRPGTSGSSRAPYFVEWVRRILMDRYGMEIYSAGFRVHTTFRPDVHAAADSALRAQLRWIEGRAGFRAPTYEETRNWPEERLSGSRMPYLQGGFLAMDPRTGEVLTLIGGRDFRDSEFDRMTQARRQPGSVFKPFVYTAAIASEIPASEIIYDTPVEVPLPDGTLYAPRNFTGEFHGPVTLREALYRSINVVAVKLGGRVGYETVAQYAERMGIRTPVPRVPSVSIGAAAVGLGLLLYGLYGFVSGLR